jgi:hypothetical protein
MHSTPGRMRSRRVETMPVGEMMPVQGMMEVKAETMEGKMLGAMMALRTRPRTREGTRVPMVVMVTEEIG